MFVAGAILMIAAWPWTVFVMLPLNNQLMATPVREASADIRSGLTRWNKLHAVRTALGCLAVMSFFFALCAAKT